VTNLRPGGRTAEIVSLVVRSDARGRGLGKLLLASVEAELEGRRVASVDLLFRETWAHTDALRSLLAGRGWSTPRTEVVLAGTDDRFLGQPWLRERPLPAGYEIFAWTELTVAERRAIVRRQQREAWYPESLSPFQMEERIAPEVSVGLRHRGAVVGWLVVHRATDEVLQYTALFVEPGHGKVGRGLPLVAAAARRQTRDTDVPRAIFMVRADNTRMLRLLDRRLLPYLAERTELLRSGKRLLAVG
jgi:GNAT superfamily N-acetyltransferase